MSTRESVRGRAVAGTLAACLGLAAGRWGSYLGHSPLFLTDVLVAAACARAFWQTERSRGGAAARASVAPFALLLGWAFIRFVAGARADITALRDAAPYFYSALGIVAGVSLVRSTEADRARTAKFLVWALTFHTIWVFVDEVVSNSLSSHLPLLSAAQGVHVLSVRPDFDVSIVGVYAAYLLATALRTRWSWKLAGGVLISLAAIAASGSRAGILGAMVPILAVGWGAVRGWRIPYSTRMVITGCAVIAAGLLALALPSTVGGQRLLATVGVRSSVATGARGIGSTGARERAWKTLVDYSWSSPTRFAAGVGFGPDYMSQTGALVELVGLNPPSATDPRSPHSWWVGTLVRMGIIGLLLLGVLVVAVARSFRFFYSDLRTSDDALPLIAGLVVLALILPTSFGVIMESPFGAVPVFWCAGVLLNYHRRPLAVS